MVPKMETEKLNWTRQKNEEELYKETEQWKSSLKFSDNAILFVERLLNSYVFEPDTPDLFEWLQNHKIRLHKVRAAKKEIQEEIRQHKNMLAGILESAADSCDVSLLRKHALLKQKVNTCTKDFKDLKADVFNYAGAILRKKRKP